MTWLDSITHIFLSTNPCQNHTTVIPERIQESRFCSLILILRKKPVDFLWVTRIWITGSPDDGAMTHAIWNLTSHLHLDGDLTWPARMYAHMYTYICTYYKYIYPHKHVCMYVCTYVRRWELKFQAKELKDLACPRKSWATLNISNWFFTLTFFIVSELLSYNSRALTLPNCDVTS